MGQHTRISSASSSRIDQILASQEVAWRTRTHSTISSFSDHNMVIIQLSDTPINKDPVINTGHNCRVKPYMVAPAADKIDNLISIYFPPHKQYELGRAASKMEALKKLFSHHC